MSVSIACALGSHSEIYPPHALLTLSVLLHLLYKIDVIVLTVALFLRPRAVFVLHGGCCRGLFALQCPDPQWGRFYRAMQLFYLTIVPDLGDLMSAMQKLIDLNDYIISWMLHAVIVD